MIKFLEKAEKPYFEEFGGLFPIFLKNLAFSDFDGEEPLIWCEI